MTDDFTNIDRWRIGKKAYPIGCIPIGKPSLLDLAHRQGVKMRVYHDHIELWATVKPPWWAFWRKPTTEMRMVARAEGQPSAGDIMQLLNKGETFYVTVNGEEVLAWPKP